ncbi:hypothetical protein NV379_17450 [Paenibacillus sp. N1-5-1-14]|nr:hypothetical protein [Paenibacillus radicibacter]MCR8644443.1 hypothetical protein [Paenibacillus radicibacter]
MIHILEEPTGETYKQLIALENMGVIENFNEDELVRLREMKELMFY